MAQNSAKMGSSSRRPAIEVPMAVVYASLSPLGWGRLTASGAG